MLKSPSEEVLQLLTKFVDDDERRTQKAINFVQENHGIYDQQGALSQLYERGRRLDAARLWLASCTERTES